jgi:hypothetical protein
MECLIYLVNEEVGVWSEVVVVADENEWVAWE